MLSKYSLLYKFETLLFVLVIFVRDFFSLLLPPAYVKFGRHGFQEKLLVDDGSHLCEWEYILF